MSRSRQPQRKTITMLLERLWNTLVEVATDLLQIAWLQLAVNTRKIGGYNRIQASLAGLRNVVDALERNLDELSAQVENRDERIEKLKREYETLEASKASEVEASTGDDRLALFKKLEPLATQLPTVRNAVQNGGDVSAEDVVALLSPLEEALGDLGFEPIGEAGGEAKFDAKLHKAVGKGARSVKKGDKVKVRYVGYTRDGNVVTKAQVTAINP